MQQPETQSTGRIELWSKSDIKYSLEYRLFGKKRVIKEYLLNRPDQRVGKFLQENWMLPSGFKTLGPTIPTDGFERR